jgi:serine phosphatase RsbU (regulator of sigma subunit)
VKSGKEGGRPAEPLGGSAIRALPGTVAPPPLFEPVAFAKDAAISIAVGMGIALLISIPMPSAWRPRMLAYGALIGIFINFFCHFLHKVYSRRLAREGREVSRFALSAVYFVGGVLGWMLATRLAIAMTLVPAAYFDKLMPYFIPFSGVMAIVIGLLFFTYGRMQERLRENITQLKEAEFAQKELDLARSIQKRLLPPTEIDGETWRLAARNLAARFVAGDFYDVFPLSDGAVGVAVADVAGKGMGASLIMASVKAVLPLLAEHRSVAETLTELNRRLVLELGPREFVALALVRYRPDGTFSLANAGLPDPYRLRHGQPPLALSSPGPRLPLGLKPNLEYASLEGRLDPGERLLLFTDGLPEAPSSPGEPLGYVALEGLFDGEGSTGSPALFLDGLFDRVHRETSTVLDDDWTALALERK